MKFKATLDKLTQILTALVVVVFVALIFFLSNVSQIPIYGRVSLYIGVAILFGAYLFYPKYYQVDENSVTVKSPLFSRSISRTKIIEVKELPKEELQGSIRAFGSGGYFGYFGLFYNSQLKWMTWFGTQRKNYVLVRTEKWRYIFTPDNPQEFVSALSRS